jgi:hypothetical protein
MRLLLCDEQIAPACRLSRLIWCACRALNADVLGDDPTLIEQFCAYYL